MKLSQLIQAAQEALASHGDLVVKYEDAELGDTTAKSAAVRGSYCEPDVDLFIISRREKGASHGR